MKHVLVIPSNREANLLAFLNTWRSAADWQEIVIVEDNERRTFRLPADLPWPVHHVSHAEIDARLGCDARIVSRSDSAIRCFGFLVAAKDLGADYVLTLDDDCYPIDGAKPICAAHLAAARSHAVCRSTVYGLRVRGLPYRNLGRIESKLNMGLWRGNADVDGPTGLTPQPYFVPPPGSTLANPQHRFPICGMNLFFHRELLPAMFFPPMGRGSPYRRFDDIWFGWAFQRLAEHCGIAWSFGDPQINHIRASDPFRNLVAEAPGIAANEMIWAELNAIPLSATTLAAAAAELAEEMQRRDAGYIATWGAALAAWLRHAR